VNTCTVTNEGDSKSRKIIRSMARKNPDARIIVMGCYATRDPEAVSQLPNVSEVVTDKRELPDLLGRFGVIDVPDGISRFGNRHRSYVKVQDGCLLRCSYCIIPKVRPEMYSRPVQPILDEVRRMVDNGFREIVLTGVHLGHYGVDWNRSKPKSEWIRLSHLVRQIIALPGDFRVRLSSIEATEVTRELIDVMAEFPDRVCPHLHICLQSGSESVLRRMNRRWGAQRFIDRCQLVRESLDNPAITSDVIVGFPGETEAEFQETIDTVKASEFSKIHIFPFSGRRDTPAHTMEGQLEKSVKTERLHRLAKIERGLRSNYFDSLVGRQLRVLVESTVEESGNLAGTSCRYSPTIVSLPDDSNQPIPSVGEFVDVVAKSADDSQILATIV
jgi:threonylcarbamoyladenosine tRNA methylthiotransferase MtaB